MRCFERSDRGWITIWDGSDAVALAIVHESAATDSALALAKVVDASNRIHQEPKRFVFASAATFDEIARLTIANVGRDQTHEIRALNSVTQGTDHGTQIELLISMCSGIGNVHPRAVILVIA